VFSQIANQEERTQPYRKHRVAQYCFLTCSSELSRSARRCSMGSSEACKVPGTARPDDGMAEAARFATITESLHETGSIDLASTTECAFRVGESGLGIAKVKQRERAI
jgi:hypothetical protein